MSRARRHRNLTSLPDWQFYLGAAESCGREGLHQWERGQFEIAASYFADAASYYLDLIGDDDRSRFGVPVIHDLLVSRLRTSDL